MDTRNADPIWEEALEIISHMVNEGTFRIWFEPTIGLGFADGVYSVGVASEFAKDWIDARFRPLVADAVSPVVDQPTNIDIVVSPTLSRAASTETMTTPRRPDHTGVGANHQRTTKPASQSSVSAGHRPLPTDVSRDVLTTADPSDTGVAAGLLEKYTFDTFVIGPSNRFAHAAALATAETPGTQYNPLFVYGGVGLGKTHLLQAIGNYVTHNHVGKRVLYLTLETFTNDFINSLRDDSIEGFKKRYRTVDVLLIDDIQFLYKKEQTQEEFFHTFNALYDAQKQIVIASDRHPKALATVEDRLISRFEWGLITDIQPRT